MTSRSLTATVDLGGTSIKIAAFLGNEMAASRCLPSHSQGTLKAQLGAIEGCLHDLSKVHGTWQGVAWSYPGLVDPKRNLVLSASSKFVDAVDFDGPAWARTTFGVPFLWENDANAALVGEHRHGCAQGYQNLVLLILGTGVGTAALMDGRLVRGAHNQAGVLGGHFKTSSSSRVCSCGKTGCLEAEVGSWTLNDRSGGKYENYPELFQACDQGHPQALVLRDESVEAWARGLTTLVHAYDPEAVVLSGGVMNGAASFSQALQARVGELAWLPWGKLPFLTPETPGDSVLWGLNALMEEKLHG